MAEIVDREGVQLAALRRFQDFSGLRVLEVGCGRGRLTAGIAEHASHVLAFDPDSGAISQAQGSLPPSLASHVVYRVASALDIELSTASWDVVLFSWSL